MHLASSKNKIGFNVETEVFKLMRALMHILAVQATPSRVLKNIIVLLIDLNH